MAVTKLTRSIFILGTKTQTLFLSFKGYRGVPTLLAFWIVLCQVENKEKMLNLGRAESKNQCIVAHVTLFSIKLHTARIPQYWLCGSTYARVGT